MRKRSHYLNNKFLQMLGENIRNLRVDRSLSQVELGERCGVHRTYITEIENGLRNVSVLTMSTLAEALGVDACVLLHCKEAH